MLDFQLGWKILQLLLTVMFWVTSYTLVHTDLNGRLFCEHSLPMMRYKAAMTISYHQLKVLLRFFGH